MAKKDDFVNYYKILQCDRTASNEELKKSYQKLILSLHPDKLSEGYENDTFYLVQKAWLVLKDPVSRKQYDAEVSCHEHSELLLYDNISLSEMEFDSSERLYSFSCRCGGTYILDSREMSGPKVIIGCDECSFSIQVKL